MPIASWREPLDRAIERNRNQPHSRYFQLATVRTDGHPANRTVVFRGFLGETNQHVPRREPGNEVTDSRSEKANQIYEQPWGEICWYFTETREQFRIAGQMTLVGPTHPDPELQIARSILWQELSDKARQQFLWPHPGTASAGGDARATAFSPTDPTEPEKYFCLLLLDPVMVDRLELTGDPHNRWIYLRDRDLLWSTKAINP